VHDLVHAAFAAQGVPEYLVDFSDAMDEGNVVDQDS
jgi:hypothetical protein